MAITTLNNRAINRSDTAAADQLWTATSATATDFQAVSAGKILQMVSATDSTIRSFTSSSFGQQSSTMNFDITPAATSSKILLMGSTAGYVGGGQGIQATLFRDSTNLGDSSNGMVGHYTGTNSNGAGLTIIYVDSPSSTSAITYSYQFKGNDTTTKYINCDGKGIVGVGSLIGLEIGA